MYCKITHIAMALYSFQGTFAGTKSFNVCKAGLIFK